jgi:hypothetical protein
MSVFIQRPARNIPYVNPALADTLPDTFVPSDEDPLTDELEDTQPSLILPDAEDDFADAPTNPGFQWRADGTVARALADHAGAEGQWDRVLRAVAVAVKRVFASHSLKGLS